MPPGLPDAERGSSPRGLNPAAHHLHHHHHPQHRHFSAASSAGGGLYGEDDNFDFLRTILLDAGDGSALAAAHHHHHGNNAALPSLGAGYVPISTFAPISAAKSPAYAGAVTSAPQALHPVLASSSMAAAAAAAGGRRFPAPVLSSSSFSSGGGSSSSSGGALGATGVAGYPRAGGGARGGYPATEEEKLQAADDIARCIWLAGDEIREVLLSRLREVWGAAEADMVSVVVASGAAAGPSAEAIVAGGGGASPASSKKRFNEVLLERLEVTCKEVEAELKAAEGRGDSSAFCDPPQHHWRGGPDLRDDILSRLETFQRHTEEETRGMPGFPSMRRMDDLGEQQRQRAVSSAVPAAVAAPAPAVAAARGAGVRRTAPPGRSRVDLKQGADGAPDGTGRVVKSELLMYGDGEGATGAAGTDAGNPPPTPGGRRGGATRGRRTPDAEAPGSSPAGAGGTPKRKRKRSGNGRRCKHEGW